LKLKFQTVAEKTAKNFRGLLYFAAPGTLLNSEYKLTTWICTWSFHTFATRYLYPL